MRNTARAWLALALGWSVATALCGCVGDGDAPAATQAPVTVTEIGSHFSSARKWFGMVRDLQFDHAKDGDLVPRFATEHSELVRRRDAAGQTLAPRLPSSATGAFTIALTSDPSVWVKATEPALGAVPARIEKGVVVYRRALSDGDLLYKLTPTHVDEYVYLRHPPAHLRRTVTVQVGPGVSELRQTLHSVEVVNQSGASMMRVSAPLARAADGKRRLGTIRLEGSRLVLDIDLRGLAPPVLVDPDWETTGTMTVGHWMYASWMLPNDNVVVAGGCALAGCPASFARPNCGQVLADTEIWNEGTGTWAAGPPLGTARFSFASVTLDGGDLLAMGGCTTTGCDATTDAVERYVAADNRWEALPPLSSPRAHAAAVRLNDGSVIVVGGCDATSCTATVDRLEPASGAWSSAAPLSQPRGFATATKLDDGRVLVVGGCADPACAQMLGDAEVYDPVADAWSPAGAMTTPRAGHSATLLGDGSVLVGGGCADADCMRTLATAERWYPATNAFQAVPPMPGARHDHTATLLASGQVLFAGGASGPTSSLPSAVIYLPVQNRWVALQNMVLDRAYHVALRLPSNDVLVAGGCNKTTCMPWAEVLSPARIPSLVADAGASPDAGGLDAGGLDAGALDAGAGPVDAGSYPEPQTAHPAAYRTGATQCADDTSQDLGCPASGHPLQDADFQPSGHDYDSQGDAVLDRGTGLTWQAADDGNTYTRDAAEAHCAALSTAGAPAGSWRLPSVVELATLIDAGRHEPSIDPAFTGTVADSYWTSTPVASGPAQGWTVKFDFGEILPMIATHANHVRCVRGDFAGGRLHQSGPFVVQPQTLQDPESGLEWQRYPDGVRRTWSQALGYCAGLHLDGKTGWHLPNVNELRGLVDYGSLTPVRADPVFDALVADTYWSSTPTYGVPSLAQAISFNLGVQDGVSVDSPAYAVCVRHISRRASGGCGCGVVGARSNESGWAAGLLVLLVLGLGLRRRAIRTTR